MIKLSDRSKRDIHYALKERKERDANLDEFANKCLMLDAHVAELKHLSYDIFLAFERYVFILSDFNYLKEEFLSLDRESVNVESEIHSSALKKMKSVVGFSSEFKHELRRELNETISCIENIDTLANCGRITSEEHSSLLEKVIVAYNSFNHYICRKEYFIKKRNQYLVEDPPLVSAEKQAQDNFFPSETNDFFNS